MRLAHGDARVDHLVHDHQRQAEEFRRHEAQCDVVLRQQFGQRVHCASVAQIAHHRDLEAIDTAKLLPDGVQIQQRLGGMLARAVACVDDRHAGVVGGHLGRADFRVAQDDGIAVLFQRAHGVGQCFALAHRTELNPLRNRDHAAAQPLHGCDKRGAGARARLVEEAGQHVAAQQVAHAVLLDHGAHRLRLLKNVSHILAVELRHRQNILAGEAVAGDHLGSIHLHQRCDGFGGHSLTPWIGSDRL